MASGKYIVGHTYRDTGTTGNANDQFLRWINIEGSGMLNSPGVRPLRYVVKDVSVTIPAYVVLVTHEKKNGARNPWDDVVDYSVGKIIYWGDAKYHEHKRHNDYKGNKCLEAIYNLVLDQKFELVPPILHFSKPEKGVVRFNGVCVLDKLELTWFSDQNTPVRNYRCYLSILDIDEASLDWLHSRAKAKSIKSNDNLAPRNWLEYKKGIVKKINVWAPQIRTREQQVPQLGTPESKILEQLSSLTPAQFEAVTVAMFKQLPDVTHSITQTRLTADGGFDFYGRFTLPFPISYDIHFLGEAKKFDVSVPVQPKHVSRLVARLQRGQYGIFVTTSYYTRQTQMEVLEDGYPVKLFSGNDLIMFLKELNLINYDRINQEWLSGIS